MTPDDTSDTLEGDSPRPRADSRFFCTQCLGSQNGKGQSQPPTRCQPLAWRTFLGATAIPILFSERPRVVI